MWRSLVYNTAAWRWNWKSELWPPQSHRLAMFWLALLLIPWPLHGLNLKHPFRAQPDAECLWLMAKVHFSWLCYLLSDSGYQASGKIYSVWSHHKYLITFNQLSETHNLLSKVLADDAQDKLIKTCSTVKVQCGKSHHWMAAVGSFCTD